MCEGMRTVVCSRGGEICCRVNIQVLNGRAQVQGQCLGRESVGFAFGKESARGGEAHLNEKVRGVELFLCVLVLPAMAAVNRY